MLIKITKVSVSKKNKVWIQAEVTEGETPRTDTTYECVEVAPKEEPKKDDKK